MIKHTVLKFYYFFVVTKTSGQNVASLQGNYGSTLLLYDLVNVWWNELYNLDKDVIQKFR